MRFFVLPIFLLPLLATFVSQTRAQDTSATLDSRRAELKRFLNDEWEHSLRHSPEFATHVGDNRYDDRLSDLSDKAIADNLEHQRQALKRFEVLDVTGFPDEEKLNHALMVRSLREDIERARFKDWEMPATQFGGVHLGYASLPTYLPFRSVKDYENYLARLHQIPRVLDQATGHMRDGLRDHLVPPKYLLEKVAAQAQQVADASLDNNTFTEPARKFPDSISPDDRKRLQAGIEEAFKNEVAPAYAKFAKFVRETTLLMAASIPVFGRFPMGTRVTASPSITRAQPTSPLTRFTKWD